MVDEVIKDLDAPEQLDGFRGKPNLIPLINTLACWKDLMLKKLFGNVLGIPPALSRPDVMLCQLFWLLVEVTHDEAHSCHTEHHLLGEGFQQLIT